ncbi:putative uncharacterized protein [Acetobacter sp. CAG:977]|nr:putative uncharacterized protein [Acetobacter sp. CAG:977]
MPSILGSNIGYPYSICVISKGVTKYHVPVAPSILYHYTNFDSFKNIISSKSLFLSSLLNTNDRLEMVWLIKIVEEEIRRRNSNIFLEITLETLKAFLYKPYYVSFSELKDDINQWTKYGNNGQGVSIGFSSKSFPFNKKLPLIGYCFDTREAVSLLKIDYAEKRMIKEINCILENVIKEKISPSEAAFCISKMSFTCKHYAWSSEKEWRIVWVPIALGAENFFDLKVGQEQKILAPKEIITANGEKKEICEMKFHPTDIAEVIIGPKNHIEIQEVEKVLTENGYDIKNTTRVFYSNSPLQ